MTKEEILELLRANLSVEITKSSDWDSESKEVRVSLLLEGEEISYDYIYIKE